MYFWKLNRRLFNKNNFQILHMNPIPNWLGSGMSDLTLNCPTLTKLNVSILPAWLGADKPAQSGSASHALSPKVDYKS